MPQARCQVQQERRSKAERMISSDAGALATLLASGSGFIGLGFRERLWSQTRRHHSQVSPEAVSLPHVRPAVEDDPDPRAPCHKLRSPRASKMLEINVTQLSGSPAQHLKTAACSQQ